MKKSLIALTFAICSFSQASNAAIISVGPYAFDDTATASVITGGANIITSTDDGSAITDQLLSTYIYGDKAPGNIGLTFGSNIYNGTEADLVLYFIRGDQDTLTPTVDVTIEGNAVSYTASLFTYVDPLDGLTKKYQTLLNGGITSTDINSAEGFDIYTALIELDDFALDTDSILDLQISGLDDTERLAMVAGFNITPVPVPAPLFLLLSGIAGLSLFSRRK